MKSMLFLVPIVAIVLLAGERSASAQHYYGPARYSHDVEDSIEQRAYYDGMKGAERDFKNHRQPNVNNRDEYRDPDSVPRWGRHEYREGFRRGYYNMVRRIYGANSFDGYGRYNPR